MALFFVLANAAAVLFLWAALALYGWPFCIPRPWHRLAYHLAIPLLGFLDAALAVAIFEVGRAGGVDSFDRLVWAMGPLLALIPHVVMISTWPALAKAGRQTRREGNR